MDPFQSHYTNTTRLLNKTDPNLQITETILTFS